MNDIRFHVSPQGNDTFSGRFAAPQRGGTDGPFASLARARDAIRALKQEQGGALAQPVKVLVQGGRYELAETLTFGPEDSGTPEFPIVYAAAPGQVPVLSGGRRIGGWQTGEINGQACWRAELADVRDGRWYFTQLFVNGERRARPRLPRTGYYHFTGIAGYANTGSQWMVGPDRANFAPGELRAWQNLADVEIVALQLWFDTHHRIKNLSETTHTVYFRAKSLGSLKDEKNEFARYYVENVREALLTPGEWYLDRTEGALYYLPLPGETPAATEVIAPQLWRLVEFKGEPDRRVAHVRLENLAFTHAEWQLPVDNPGAIQAAFCVPGAIIFDQAEECVLYGCTVSRIAQYGIEVLSGSTRNWIVGCGVHDAGAGGIKIGHETLERLNETNMAKIGVARDVPAMETRVTDCVISDVGILYPSAIGIWIGNSSRNRIRHNHIFNCNYTGISCGWTWGYAPTRTVDNRIEYNHIHHINHREILSDNGGIYTLGTQPGTILRGNVLHDISCYGYGGWGIYPDEGSSEELVEKNLVYRTKCAGYSTHYGRDNVARNNIFALSLQDHLCLGKDEMHRSTIFTGNVCCFATGAVKGIGNCSLARFLVADNLIWTLDGSELTFNGAPLADWAGTGQFANTVVADPLFQDPAAGDFSLRGDSPALKLGFKPFDTTLAGPRFRGKRPASFAAFAKRGLAACPEMEIVRTILTWSGPAECGMVAATGTLHVALVNVGRVRSAGSVRLAAAPAAQVQLDGEGTIAFDLAPGEQIETDIRVQVAGGTAEFHIDSEPDGPGLMPARLLLMTPAATVRDIPRLTTTIANVNGVKPFLAAQPSLPIRSAAAEVADLRLALSGQTLALAVRVKDAAVRQNLAQPWTASCLELFTFQPRADDPKTEDVRQFFLVPAQGEAPAYVAWLQHPNGTITPAPEVQVRSTATPGGYELEVLLPLELLRVAPDAAQFGFELVVNAAGAGVRRVRAVLFGLPANGWMQGHGTLRVTA